MDHFFSAFEEFVKSKNFEKIIYLVPKISKAKTWKRSSGYMTSNYFLYSKLNQILRF